MPKTAKLLSKINISCDLPINNIFFKTLEGISRPYMSLHLFFIASIITGIIESIFKLGIGTYAFLPTYYFAYSSHDAFDIRLLYPIPLTIVLILWLNYIIKKKEIN